MIRRFFEELKRRRVIAVVTWYVLAAWVLLQVADVLGPVLTGGDAALRFVVWLAVLGFPLALFLGWRYDFSSGEVVRTAPADAGERTPLGARDFALLGVMAAAVVALGIFAFRQAGDAPVVQAIGAPNSVAVLRIEDRTGGLSALAEELSDQLVTTLIANDNLAVSGRASSFYFADHPTDLPSIARLLDVRHLLTGRLSGDAGAPTLRFELLTMPSGDVAWADDVDFDPTRPWLLYAPVADDIAEALGVEAGSTAGTRVGANPEVENLLRLAPAMGGESAIPPLDRAQALAPDDPRVWVRRARVEQNLLMRRLKPMHDAMVATRAALDRARDLGADDYLYHWTEGIYHRRLMRLDGVTAEREQTFYDYMDRAIALNPSDAVPYLSYSIHHRLQRRYDEAADLLRRSLERDPLYAGARMQYSRILSAQGRKDEALRWVVQLPPLFDSYWGDVVDRYREFNEFDRALWWFLRTPDKPANARSVEAGLWGQVRAIDEARAIYESLLDDPMMGFGARHTLAAWDPERGPAVALEMALAELDDAVPDQRQRGVLSAAAWAAAAAGEDEQAVSLIQRAHPELLDTVAPDVTAQNAGAALALASALRRSGQDPVREGVLASQLLAHGRNRPVLGFDGIGDLTIRVYAYRGDADRAIELLEAAYNDGFRALYDNTGALPPEYGPLLDDPRFQAVRARIDADLEAMVGRVRQWLADGTDLMGPPPTELATLSSPAQTSP